MECAAYYVRHCTAELWPLVLLAVASLAIACVLERRAPLPARPGWFGRALSLALGGFTILVLADWFLGLGRMPPLEDRLAECNAEHRVENERACARS